MFFYLLFLSEAFGCSSHEALSPDGSCVRCSDLYPDCYQCEFVGSSNRVQNGDFEIPSIPSNSNIKPSTLEGWELGGPSPYFEVEAYPPAYQGSQYVELDVSTNCDIFQTLDLLGGREYSLFFAYAVLDNTAASTNEVEIYINDALVDTLARSGGDSQVWTTHSYTFTATRKTTIKFSSTGTSDGIGALIDDVRVEITDPELAYEVRFYYDPGSTCTLCGPSTYFRPECEISLLPTDPVTRCFSSVVGGTVKPKVCFAYYPVI